MEILATGDVLKFGTLYIASTKQARPTRPWDTMSTPEGSTMKGNIPLFIEGQTIEIRDSDTDDAYKIQWVEIVEGGKRYYVADRNILANVLWDELNTHGFINGKEITIDGKKYLIRVLTGGGDTRNLGGNNQGGTLPNEWDRWITNEDGQISNLPIPTFSDLDGTRAATDLNGAHNQKWNWFYISSWCKEEWARGGAEYRVHRGHNSPRYWGSAGAYRHSAYGWRPVLELLNTPPIINGDAQNQGNKQVPFSVNYQVTDFDNDVVNIVEKLNGTIIRTLNNVALGATQTITITNEQWMTIPLRVTSTITVEATDSKGAKSTREFTFVKANAAPTVTAVEPKGNLSNLAIIDTLTPVFVWTFQDTDVGDVQSAYQVLIYDTNNQLIHDSSKKTGTASYYTVPENILQWGTLQMASPCI